MTTAAFIRKWLANPEKHYDEHCRNEMLDDLYSVIEQAQTEQKLNVHGVGGPASAVSGGGELLATEAGGKAGEVEVLNIKTGQLISVDGYGFMFGKDLNSGEIRCFNIENLSGESREGALH
jgi:hypothetical protein